MATMLLDVLSFSRGSRWNRFISSVSNEHPYVAHVGAGWAFARIPWIRGRCDRRLPSFDPLLRWLILDGYGFHEGYFDHRSVIDQKKVSRSFSGYSARVFDQGLGRSLWFVEGADVVRIANRIATFDVARQADFWSGVGLACAYAGKPTVPEIECLMEKSGKSLLHFAQGVTFGAEARVHGGIDDPFTDRVCMVVCGLSSAQAADVTSEARGDVAAFEDLPDFPRYERWRIRIRELLQVRVAT